MAQNTAKPAQNNRALMSGRGDSMVGDSTSSLRDSIADLIDGRSLVGGKVPGTLRYAVDSRDSFRDEDSVRYFLDDLVSELRESEGQPRPTILLTKARNMAGDYLDEETREPEDIGRAAAIFKADRDGGDRASKEWRRVFYDDPEMIETWRSAALDDLSKLISGGALPKKSYQRWREARREALRSFPEIEREIETARGRSQALFGRARERRAQEMSREDKALQEEMDTWKKDFNGDDSGAYEIMKLISHNDDAVRGARRAAWGSKAFAAEGPAKFEKHLIDRKGALTQFLGREHLDNLSAVAQKAAKENMPVGSALEKSGLVNMRNGGRVPMLPSIRMPLGHVSLSRAMSEAMHDPVMARALARGDASSVRENMVRVGKLPPDCGED